MIRGILTLVGIVLVAGLCVVTAIVRGHGSEARELDREPLAVATPAPAPPSPAPQWLAVVVPAGEVAVTAPPSGGRLAEITVRLGDRVAAGDVVARLDPERARSSIAEAEARLAAREAERRQAAARRAQARDRLVRIEKLGELVSEAERTEASLGVSSAQADVDRTAAEIRVQRLVVDQLTTTLRHTTIVAPIAGEVSTRLFDAGAEVDGGAVLLRIVDPARRLRLAVPPDGPTPAPGDRIAVRCGPQSLVAIISQVAPHLDPAARVVLVEATPQGGEALRLGDTCTASPRP